MALNSISITFNKQCIDAEIVRVLLLIYQLSLTTTAKSARRQIKIPETNISI